MEQKLRRRENLAKQKAKYKCKGNNVQWEILAPAITEKSFHQKAGAGIVKMVSGQFATTINSPPQNSPSLESQIASLNLKSSPSSETYIK